MAKKVDPANIEIKPDEIQALQERAKLDDKPEMPNNREQAIERLKDEAVEHLATLVGCTIIGLAEKPESGDADGRPILGLIVKDESGSDESRRICWIESLSGDGAGYLNIVSGR